MSHLAAVGVACGLAITFTAYPQCVPPCTLEGYEDGDLNGINCANLGAAPAPGGAELLSTAPYPIPAYAAARLCAVNLLAQAKSALEGDLTRIKAPIRIGVFVSSSPDFHEHHLVANGASDLIAEVLGEAGIHARAAVGVACLPLNAAVEAEAIFEIV